MNGMSGVNTPYEIFISYSRKDNQPLHPEEAGWVNALRDHILADHRSFSTEPLRIFLDSEEIRDMDDWQHRILAALQHSKILLICLSPNYFTSDYCRWEWEEYRTRQVHRLMGAESVSSIYFVEVPGSVVAQNQIWYESTGRGNYTDIRPWYPEGVKALQKQEVQRRLAALGQSLWQRLERARRAEATPGNLRRQNPYFVGRSEELRRLHENLIKGAVGVVTALHGLGGQGKTELAVAYAHAWADCYPAGLWVLAAEGRKELLPLIGELAYAPELNHAPSDAAKADPVLLGREVLVQLERRVQSLREKDPDQGAAALLILDNVSDPALLSGAQLATLPQANWLRMVATTRLSKESLPSQKGSLALVEVDSLDPVDALTLLRDHQPEQRFVSLEEEAAAGEIVADLGGFTLAVEQVAVYLGLHPEIAPSAYLQALRKKGLTLADAHGRRKEVAGEIRHREKQLGLILKATLAMLEPAGHTALGFAALLPLDWVPWPWLEDLTRARHPELARGGPAEPDPWIGLRRQLEGLRLLTPGDQAETGRLHRLVAAHLREGEAEQGTTAANRQALVDYLAMRLETLSLSPAPPPPWEMEALLLSLPGLLKSGENSHDLANWTVFFSDKVVTYHYRTLATARLLLDAAHAVLLENAATDSFNSDWQRDLAVSYGKVGDVLIAQGDLGQALSAYRKTHGILEKLANADPTSSVKQRDLSVSYGRVGDVLKTQGDLGQAISAYQKSLAIREKLAASDRSNSEWQRDLAVSYSEVGDVLIAQGDLGQTISAYQKSLAIREKLAASDRSNSEWQRDLSLSYGRVGDVLIAQGDLGQTISAYQKSLATSKKLAEVYPANSEWQRDLAVSYSKVGDVLIAQGDLGQALSTYRKSLAIAEKLAAADPANSEWQRDLAVSYERVGDVLKAQSNLGQALSTYRKSLAIAEKLAAADPSNSQWQRDLAVSYDKVGDVLQAQGDLRQALSAFHKSLAITIKLAAADPSNSQWQRDLVISLYKLATIWEQAGNEQGGLAHWQQCLAVLQGMRQKGMYLDPWLVQLLQQLEQHL